MATSPAPSMSEPAPPSGVSGAHFGKQLGLKQYCNSPTMSDIIIRFGSSGERMFYGHKVVLCARSYWFQAALNGRFIESVSTEIQLHDDNDDALQYVLEAAYLPPLPEGWDPDQKHATPANDAQPEDISSANKLALFWLRCLRVADKYDFADMQARLQEYAGHELDDYTTLAACHTACTPGFLEVVREIYDLPPTLASKVRIQFFDCVMCTRSLWSSTAVMLRCVAKQHAEFAQELLDHMLRDEEKQEDKLAQ